MKPYLISKSETGEFHVTIRTTRLNSQGYPLVTAEKLDAAFLTISKARLYLRAEHHAEAADIATA